MSYIQNRTDGSGGAGVLTLTGNTGGAVGATLGNINVIGAGIISVAGNPGTSTLTISANGDLDYVVVSTSTSPYVVNATDQVVSMNSSGGTKTVQLPNAPSSGRWFIVKDGTGSAAANNITVTTVGGAVFIDAATTFVMNTAYQSVTVVFDGAKYLVI